MSKTLAVALALGLLACEAEPNPFVKVRLAKDVAYQAEEQGEGLPSEAAQALYAQAVAEMRARAEAGRAGDVGQFSGAMLHLVHLQDGGGGETVDWLERFVAAVPVGEDTLSGLFSAWNFIATHWRDQGEVERMERTHARLIDLVEAHPVGVDGYDFHSVTYIGIAGSQMVLGRLEDAEETLSRYQPKTPRDVYRRDTLQRDIQRMRANILAGK